MTTSAYLLTAHQRRRYANVGEVRISTWGVVPKLLDELVDKGTWGNSHAEVYYRLAMDKLMDIEASLRPPPMKVVR